jgi:predicted RNA-binding Zn ribbon-like protein
MDAKLPRRLGGEFCLDFVNTVDPRPGGHDYLADPEALVAWADYVGLTPKPVPAEEAGRARKLREALYRIFSTVARGDTAPPEDLEIVTGAYAAALAGARLAPYPESAWVAASNDLLLPVLDSAISLLRSPRLVRVKECPGADPCGWLFLDTTKNGRRRWCSMDGCGSRAKMRRYRARAAAH